MLPLPVGGYGKRRGDKESVVREFGIDCLRMIIKTYLIHGRPCFAKPAFSFGGMLTIAAIHPDFT
jgi:hypothetical protein